MRGKLFLFLDLGSVQRITPAHAGKTSYNVLMTPPPSDHPRTCGENRLLRELLLCHFGSPPHMRGKRVYQLRTGLFQRITPAHAGKTVYTVVAIVLFTDHPRTCGENSLEAVGRLPLLRITPAHAGKTDRGNQSSENDADHPRTCGENPCRSCRYRRQFGSPPHMRGKHLRCRYEFCRNRITPAHAGKTTNST